MSRPRKCRWVAREPGVTFFKPQGISLKTLEHAQITVDELEALPVAAPSKGKKAGAKKAAKAKPAKKKKK